MPVRGENSLFFSTGLDNSGLQSGASDAVGIVRGLAGQIAKINPFLALGLGAAAAFATIAKSAHKMMKEFESAMAEVKTIAGLTDAEFGKLEKRVFNLSKNLGTETPAALAKGLYDIIGAGNNAADALELLEIASKAATAGVTTSAVAADGLTTILNAFQLEAKDAGEVADVMFATVDRGKISFEELSSQIAQVAPLAAASGFSFQEIGAAVATLTKQGVPASQAMTQIRSAIIATNEVLGTGASEVMTLQNAFQTMYDKAGGDQNQLQELAGRIEAVSGILAIAGPNFKGAAEDLEAMGEAAGSVDRNFKIITSTTENQWKILGNRITATTEGIGESIVSISNGIAGFINRAIQETEDMTVTIRQQANEYNILRAALDDVNTPFDEKLRILKQLKEQYPEYLESLDIDKVNNDNLVGTLQNVAGALKAINDEQDRRIKLSGIGQRQNEQAQTVEDFRAAIEKQKTNFYAIIEEIKEYAAKENIELNFSPSGDINEIYNDIARSMDGSGKFLVGQLLQARLGVARLSGEYNSANKVLEETNRKHAEARRLVYDNEEGYKEIVKQIQKINNLNQLSEFGDYQFPAIKEAFNAQRDLLTTFKTIDLAENIKSLEPFLKSENEIVKKYAQERYRILNTDYSGKGPGGGGDKDKATFAESLKAREQIYKDYQSVIDQLGQEEADKQYAIWLEEGRSYGEFLQNLLNQTTDFAKRREIALAAASSGNYLNRKPPTFDNGMTMAGIDNPAPSLAKDFTLSIDYIEGKLKELNDLFKSSTSTNAKDKIQEEIEFWSEKLNIAQSGAEDEKSIYDGITLHIDDLHNKELIKYLDYWQDKLKLARAKAKDLAEAEQPDDSAIRKANKEVETAQAKVNAATQEIGERTADTIREISGALGAASDMFRSFGEDTIADAMDKLGVLAQNMAGIITNIASGNWLGVVAGGISAIAGLISGDGGDKELSAYEKTMNRLQKSVDRLTESMSRLYGAEQLAAREKIIDTLTAEQTAIANRIKEAKAFIDSNGGRNAYTLPVVLELETLEDDLADVNNRIYDAMEELRNAATGTTQDSIADAIIQGFRDGKRGIEDFADTFEDTMREAILHTFKENFLQKELQKFYDQFAEFNVDGLTNSEIATLENLYNQVIIGAGESIDALNQILENAGFDPIGLEGPEAQRPGLAGAITNITEDTANILEGYMNAIRLDVRQGLEVAIQNSLYLVQIANNTSYLISIDRNMQSIDGRFANIEGAILEFQARG